MVTLPANHDTTFNSKYTTYSDGGGPATFAGTDGQDAVHRSVISFDVSSIPAGSTITSVQLILTLGQAPPQGPGTATISLYDVTRSWGEGTNGSTASGIAGTGHGYPANPGDATWGAAEYEQLLWTNAGGDSASTASATLYLNNATIGNAFTWSSSQMATDVQNWLNNPSNNNGWELINANEKTAYSLYGFYSREWATFPGGEASQEPALVVTYTPPTVVPVPVWAVAAAGMFTALLGGHLRPRRS